VKKPTTFETTASTTEPVSIQALLKHCNAVATDDDDLIRDLRKTAREMVEADAHLSLVSKTIRHRIPAWPRGLDPIELPAGPVTAVDSIQYRDTDGVVTVLASANQWSLDTDRRPAAIWLAPDASWPDIQIGAFDAITVTYQCGYDASTNPAPAMAVHAIKMLVAHWYTNRESVITGTISKEIEAGYKRLINILTQHRYP